MGRPVPGHDVGVVGNRVMSPTSTSNRAASEGPIPGRFGTPGRCIFNDHSVQLSDSEAAVGQAMADVATTGLLHQCNTHEQTILSEQLQTALQSRILIEQAKGALAARTGFSVNEAFHKQRTHARATI